MKNLFQIISFSLILLNFSCADASTTNTEAEIVEEAKEKPKNEEELENQEIVEETLDETESVKAEPEQGEEEILAEVKPLPTAEKKERLKEKLKEKVNELAGTEQPKIESAKPEPTKPAKAKVEETKPIIEAPTKQIPNHSNWNTILKKYVTAAGKVNYAGIKTDKAKLEAYLKDLSDNTPKGDWSRNENMAYWINAYNAFTIKLIVDNYPLKSITDLEGGKPWDKKWINLGDKTYTLNNIENDILRPKYKDARIHFAVNCAAKSCPPILNSAWTASNLNANFEKQGKAFINNSKYNSISSSSVKVSKIFEWYAGDFGNLISYLNKYAKTKINSDASLGYLEYDWTLNE